MDISSEHNEGKPENRSLQLLTTSREVAELLNQEICRVVCILSILPSLILKNEMHPLCTIFTIAGRPDCRALRRRQAAIEELQLPLPQLGLEDTPLATLVDDLI